MVLSISATLELYDAKPVRKFWGERRVLSLIYVRRQVFLLSGFLASRHAVAPSSTAAPKLADHPGQGCFGAPWSRSI